MNFWGLIAQDYFWITLGLVALFLFAGLPVGFLLIHKNLGLFSDALSHALIPGLVGAVFLMGLDSDALLIGALIWGAFVSVSFSFFSGLKEKTRDSTLVAISLFGVSSGLLLNQHFHLKVDFTHLLFGSPLLADLNDLYRILGVTLIAVLTIGFYWRSLLLYCVDPQGAKFALGEFRVSFVFSSLTTLLVVMGFQIFGVLLTTGLLILPHLVFPARDKSFRLQMVLRFLGTFLVSGACFVLSYYWNLTFSALFVLVLSLMSLMVRVWGFVR
jgi:zinc/manganese transport system permease protein